MNEADRMQNLTPICYAGIQPGTTPTKSGRELALGSLMGVGMMTVQIVLGAAFAGIVVGMLTLLPTWLQLPDWLLWTSALPLFLAPPCWQYWLIRRERHRSWLWRGAEIAAFVMLILMPAWAAAIYWGIPWLLAKFLPIGPP